MNRLSFIQRCFALLGIPFIVPESKTELLDGGFRWKCNMLPLEITDEYNQPVDLEAVDKVTLIVKAPSTGLYEESVKLIEGNKVYFDAYFDEPGEWMIQVKMEFPNYVSTSSILKVTV